MDEGRGTRPPPTGPAPEASPETAGPSNLSRWLPLALLAVFPLVAARSRFLPVGDPDAFWHVLTGQDLWRRHQLVGPDPFGTFTTETWVRHEWVPELLMAGAFHLFGLPGIAWLAFAAALVLFVVLFRACRERAGMLAAVTASVLGWVGASASMGPRPQIVSLILLTVTGAAWRRTIVDGRARWWLIPLAWVWACCHGLWLSGPVLGVAVVLGLWLNGAHPARGLARLLLVPVGSIVAAALTPAGPVLLRSVLGVAGVTHFVTEWNPPNIRDPYVAATLVMLVLVALAWARRDHVTPLAAVLTWCVALGWTLLYARTVALGAVIIAPYAADTLQTALRRPAEARGRAEILTLVAGVGASLTVCALLASRVAGAAVGMPSALEAQLSRLPTGAVVFNEYSVGGWLLLNEPRLHPVVDPRTELYSPAYLDRYARMRSAQPGWQAFLAETRPTAALVTLDSPLTEALRDSSGWSVVARGGGFVLLSAP